MHYEQQPDTCIVCMEAYTIGSFAYGLLACKCLWVSTYKILIHITCAQRPSLNAHADVTSGARDLTFGLSLHLPSCFVYASTEGAGESAHLRRLA